jgi:glutathionylspermidine synthase
MERLTVEPRADWRARVEALGFDFHTIDGKTYWDETACYRFSAEAVDLLEDVTAELERLCLQAVGRVVEEDLYDRLGIPAIAHDLVAESWRRSERNVIGRFDLSWNGRDPPKLLEYNADTPTGLFEASVVQWHWLEDTHAGADQFNSLHEKLIEAWQKYGLEGAVHFTCVADHAEDFATTTYLRDTCTQAGHETHFLTIDQIGWNGIEFVDLDRRPIINLFKLYPWEWLLADDFGLHIGESRVRLIEPAWKMILSNKAILVLLWEMFEGHPNLLPASFEPTAISGPCVEKPRLGREGEGVVIHRNGPRERHPDHIYQALAPLPEFAGNYPVIGSWVVASQPAGIGIREESGPVTTNLSRFVPHYFD